MPPTRSFARTTLILAAHGSPAAGVNEAVQRLVENLEKTGQFAQVLPAFHYGEPNFGNVLSQVRPFSSQLPPSEEQEVIVVPLMASDGYYFQKVLPEKLARQTVTESGAAPPKISLLEPLGVRAAVADQMLERVRLVLANVGLADLHADAQKSASPDRSSPRTFNEGRLPKSVQVVVVGHGTRRNPTSRSSTFAAVRRLRRLCDQHHLPVGEVVAAFLDDDPPLTEVARQFGNQHMLVIPFLATAGPHFSSDIPVALGLPTIKCESNDFFNTDDRWPRRFESRSGRQVWLDRPWGLYHGTLGQVLATLEKHVRRNDCGRVLLVGAGPGSPDLISVAGMRALENADIVIHDQLISPILLTVPRDDAVVIDAGKLPKRHKLRQEEISNLLTTHATGGKTVVRLKGGDPFVFGRGFEELSICRKHGIDCEVIPGISSAFAAGAAVGIPVTLRGVARSVTVTTGEAGAMGAGDGHSIDLAAPADQLPPGRSLGDTVVTMMGCRKLEKICSNLIACGKSPETPVVCVENATLPNQRIITGQLSTIAKQVRRARLSSPMTMIVGQVAAKCEAPEPNDDLPLAGEKFAVTGPRRSNRQVVQWLCSAGAHVVVTPSATTNGEGELRRVSVDRIHLDIEHQPLGGVVFSSDVAFKSWRDQGLPLGRAVMVTDETLVEEMKSDLPQPPFLLQSLDRRLVEILAATCGF